MATIDQIKKARLKKLKAIESAGLLVYPTTTKRTHTAKEVIEKFSKIKERVVLGGRLMSLRGHGGLLFSDLKDGTGMFQLVFRKDKLGPRGFKFFLDNFDIGDFIEVKGVLFKTKRGEKSLEVADYKILSKSLLPLPEKWHGLQDTEERFRKRYLDILFNQEVKELFILRSKIIKELRKFLDEEGFLEVETPILQPVYGGATAEPFKTHLNAQKLDLYLRISPELYLKRLMIAGFEKVYEIGKCFRNEGIDKAHNPDFTMLEFYQAYTDYKDLMKFTEKMLTSLIKKVSGKLKIDYQEEVLDFKTPWPRIEYDQLFKKYTGIKLEEISEKALKEEAKKLKIKDLNGSKFEIADEIFKKIIRPKIKQPTFVIHYPAKAFSLAKPLDKNPEKSASFQLIVNGMELLKAFSELNNPILQKERFEEQEKIFKKGFKEAQRMDKDFVEALKYGMPPTAGFGMGIDRLAMLLTNSHSAREVILFPTMKSK